MADLADVENALVAAISAVIYPSGTTDSSAIGAPCRVYRGWPNADKLDADLAAGVVNVSVFERAGMTRNTTRFPQDPQTSIAAPAAIMASVSGSVATFSGPAGVPFLAGVQWGGGTWAAPFGATDTPQTVAAALAEIVPGAVALGPSLTIAGAAGLLARTAGYDTTIAELRRQTQGFLITAWAPTPALRDTTIAIMDAALAAVNFLPLADGTGGRLIYHNTFSNDVPSKDTLWRRDLTYSVEYGTTLAGTAAELLFGVQNVTANGGRAVAIGNQPRGLTFNNPLNSALPGLF